MKVLTKYDLSNEIKVNRRLRKISKGDMINYYESQVIILQKLYKKLTGVYFK